MEKQFSASMQTMRSVFAPDKKYRVPPFQRGYIWGVEEWETLWEDLQRLREGDVEIHYMGPILLQQKGEEFLIIDGHQRLVTLTLLMLAAVQRFKEWQKEARNRGDERAENDHSERAKSIHRDFIGKLDPVTRQYSNLLTLNNWDDGFFQRLIKEVASSGSVDLEAHRGSQRQLKGCYEFFVKKIKEKFPNEEAAQELAEFVYKTIANRLYFTTILVADEASAYLIFETLNARGVHLAPTDLIKNYLCAVLAAGRSDDQVLRQVDLLSERWENLLPDLEPREVVYFLRAYMNARVSPLVRQEDLFKQIRSRVRKPEEVEEFLGDLKEKAKLYLALRQPDNEFWKNWPDQQDVKFYLKLLNIFQARQHIPLVFAVHDAIQRGKPLEGEILLSDLLRYIAIIMFRYNVVGKRNPNQMERVYNAIAVGLSDGKIVSWREVKEGLSRLYLPDEEFETEFARATIENLRVAKYILCSLEQYAQYKENFRLADHTILGMVDDPKVTIEHIFPKSDPSIPEVYRSRLGNLTLLEEPDNRRASNLGFKEKRDIYKRSKYALTQEIARRYEEWKPEYIEERQKELAQNAPSIWRLVF